MYPEKRSAVEEMAFFTLLSKSFFTSGVEMSFFKSKWAKRLMERTQAIVTQDVCDSHKELTKAVQGNSTSEEHS